MMVDRNFDDLVGRFNKNIYQSAKGKIRLAMLETDLREQVPFIKEQHRCSILDVGVGTGEFALRLAGQLQDAEVCWVLSDISENMLQQAQQSFKDTHPQQSVKFIHSPLNQLAGELDEKFDLVLCHAVIEWLEDPHAAIRQLLNFVKPGGYVSLMFFNRNSLVMRQMLNGNLKKLKSEDFRDKKTTLTPVSPLEPENVYHWLQAEGLSVLHKTGIRVMYDYMAGNVRSKRAYEEILEMEKRYSAQEPFRSLGRYIHVVCQLPQDRNVV